VLELLLTASDGGTAWRHALAVGEARTGWECAGPLGLYAFVLERALAKPLLAAFVHLPIRGEIVEVDVGAAVREWTARAAGDGSTP
jgi:hypothetical protein